MYIRGMIPRNFAELAKSVPIALPGHDHLLLEACFPGFMYNPENFHTRWCNLTAILLNRQNNSCTHWVQKRIGTNYNAFTAILL